MFALGQIKHRNSDNNKKHLKRNFETKSSQVTIPRVRSRINGLKRNSKSYYSTKEEKLGETGFLTKKAKILKNGI